MNVLDIVVIIACVLIVGGVIGKFIYRKINHLPTGECANCNKGKNLVRMYHKEYGKTNVKKCWKNC